MSSDEVTRIPVADLDEELAEGWKRLTDEPRLRGVEVYRWRDDGLWQVTAWVAEFLVEEPMASILDREMTAALEAVSGVASVVHDDREIWDVTGSPNGPDLAIAAASVIDDIADAARPFVPADTHP